MISRRELRRRDQQQQQRIDNLEATVARLEKALTAANERIADQQARIERFANDRIKAARADAAEMARLQDVAVGWNALARADQRRSERLARAVVRYWQEIGRLRRELRTQRRDMVERIGRLEDRLATLQAVTERQDRELQTRPPAPLAA